MTLYSGAKVTENILSCMRELEITMNGEPREEVEKVTHPFTAAVMAVPVHDKFKLPTIPLYDGTTDLDDHLRRYDTYLNLYGVLGEIACRAFDYTLSNAIRNGYSKLKPNSINSWNDLKKAFRDQYIGVKKIATPKERFLSMYQGPNETLKEWLARYNKGGSYYWELFRRSLSTRCH